MSRRPHKPSWLMVAALLAVVVATMAGLLWMMAVEHP